MARRHCSPPWTILKGRVIGECYERHRHQEFLRFLRRLDQEFPGDDALASGHGQLRHAQRIPRCTPGSHDIRRFLPHFVPTSSSWLNLVERWFGELTVKRIRRGSFGSVDDLKQAINEFLAAWNEHPKPFVWTATVESIRREARSRAARPSSRSSPAVRNPAHQKKGRNNCPVNSVDTTLAGICSASTGRVSR